MTAHIALPAVQGDSTTPATLAPRIITGLLRDRLHFNVLAIISRARIDSAVRRVLELKARSGVAVRPLVPLDTLRDIVGLPEHRALAAGIATRAVTLLRDNAGLIGTPRSGRTVLVQYMPETELRAGKVFAAEVRQGAPGAQSFRIGPSVSPATLDSISAVSRGAARIIVATYVRRVEGEGRFVIPQHIAEWIDTLASRERVIVVSLGNPYLLRQFPRVGTYLVTYGVADVLERAGARAALGRAPVTGTIPVSLPGFFTRGDGIHRQ